MIVVDTSALATIFFGESDAERFAETLGVASRAAVGSATAFEFVLVAFKKRGAPAVAEAQAMLALPVFTLAPWTPEQVAVAGEALLRFGSGRSRLNFGDCMSYALAKSLDAPLLYKGEDFARTDIRPALI